MHIIAVPEYEKLYARLYFHLTCADRPVYMKLVTLIRISI